MEVSMSLSPICHCQVSPTVGCHHEEEDVEVKGISIVCETSSGVEKDALSSLGFCPQADNTKARIKPKRRKFLNHMMFELRQVIFVLREEFICHLANFSEGQNS